MTIVRLSKNFTLAEFACRCGCGYEQEPAIRKQLERAVTEMMQPLRDQLDCRIHIISGARCSYWNKYVKGTTGSYHKKGMAVDFVPECSLFVAYHKLVLIPAVGGAHHYPTKGFIHGDTRPRVGGKVIGWEG